MQVGLRVAVLAVGLVVACGGQSLSRGGDDDDDDIGEGDDSGFGGSSLGGTSAGGSSAGGSSNGGVAVGGMDARGGSGFAGSGSAGVRSCAQPLDPFLAAGCDVQGIMQTACARSGCHNASFRSAGLDLTMDDFLVARILDVPATFGAINAGVGMPCTPEGCPLPGGAFLVDSVIPEASWMLRKMADFDFATLEPVSMGCGTVMPIAPGNAGYTPERMACLEEFFLAIARLGTPCVLSSEDEARIPTPPRPPPCPPEGLR